MASESHSTRLSVLGKEEWSEPEQYDAKAVVWTFLWSIFAFKIGTVAVIIWASRSWESGPLLALTTWPVLIIPAVAISGPVLFYWRLRRVRARREQLRRAEFMIE
jgi:hypothetical protein